MSKQISNSGKKLNPLASPLSTYLAIWLVIFILLLYPPLIYGFIWTDILISGGTATQIQPQIAYSGQGHLMIVWESQENGISDIYGIIQTIGQNPSPPLQICTATGNQRNPVISWDGTNYLVAWEDTRNGSSDIYAARVTPTGMILDGTVTTTSQTRGLPICSALNDQLHPSMVWSGQHYLIAWEDFRTSSGKIYAARLSKDFQLLDGSVSTAGLLIGGGTGNQSKPNVTWNGTNYFVVWENHLNTSFSDIYGSRISPSGQILDSPGIGIALAKDEKVRLNPAVASDGEDFLVVWDSHTTSYSDIMGLLVSSAGLPDPRGDFPICEADRDQLTPSVFWCQNHYLVLWKDTRWGKGELYLARLNHAGNFLDAQTKSISGITLGLAGSSLLNTPASAIWKDNPFEYIIVWEEIPLVPSSGGFDIYSQKYQNISPPVISWTGETNYQNDGVHLSGNDAMGALFEFRVKYKNPNGRPPLKYQLWIDQDDDGLYSINLQSQVIDKLMNMVPESGTDYTQGVIYKAAAIVDYAGDGMINYRFVFSDGINEATGEPTKDHEIVLGNTPPSLEWPGTTNYESDGVNPNTATGGSSFEFMVKYKDLENDSPSATQVWVDINNDNVYDESEKFSMAAYDNKSLPEGRTYLKSIQCTYVPKLNTTAAINLKYRYNFTYNNGEVVDGEPGQDHFFSITPYLSVPLLDWPSESGFSQGVRLKEETTNNNYEFCINYRDADNDWPTIKEVWIDENADGYFSQGEKHVMEELYMTDTSLVDGKMYHLITILSNAGGDDIYYKFVFSDGRNMAGGEPFLTGAQIGINSNTNDPVYLSWTNESGYAEDGVEPNTSASGSWFYFHVTYTNLNNFPPLTKELWLDENNDGQYQDEEKYPMADLNPNDLTYYDGKIYALGLKINQSYTPVNLSYKFSFQDNYLEAVGEPTESSLRVTILDPGNYQDPNDVIPTDPNSLDDPNQGDDPYTPYQLKSSQGGCFINSLF